MKKKAYCNKSTLALIKKKENNMINLDPRSIEDFLSLSILYNKVIIILLYIIPIDCVG